MDFELFSFLFKLRAVRFGFGQVEPFLKCAEWEQALTKHPVASATPSRESPSQ